MSFETIRIEHRDAIAWLILDRPDKHNAMSGLMLDELQAAAELLAADESVRAVVLTGEGESFCAGGDLDWMRQQFEATRAQREAQAMKLARMLRALNELPKPLIGRVNGQAFGGGLGMMSVCDTVIAVDTARFAFTETRLGLIPATIAPYVVARMGEARARRVFMSARMFDTQEAKELGLVAKVVPADALDAAIAAETRPYLSCSPQAVKEAKALIRHIAGNIDEAMMAHTAGRLADCWEGDAREGVQAFFEKRPPAWKKDR
jgi:methylglutaconyl-CoA hydratase